MMSAMKNAGLSVMIVGLVACGGTADDRSDESAKDTRSIPAKSAVGAGKADSADVCLQLGFEANCNVCEEYGFEPDCDLCEAWDWHDDGICDSGLVTLGYCDEVLEQSDCAGGTGGGGSAGGTGGYAGGGTGGGYAGGGSGGDGGYAGGTGGYAGGGSGGDGGYAGGGTGGGYAGGGGTGGS